MRSESVVPDAGMANNQSSDQRGGDGGGSESLQWMYRDPRSSGPSAEDYLLGLKYKDNEKNDEVKELENNRGELPGSTFLRDQRRNEEAAVRNEAIAIKREDPLFSMRDKEKQARGEVLNNPLKIKRMKQFFIEKAKDMKGTKSSPKHTKESHHKSKHEHKRKKKSKRRSSSEGLEDRDSRSHGRSEGGRDRREHSSDDSEENKEAWDSRHGRHSRSRSPRRSSSSRKGHKKEQSRDRSRSTESHYRSRKSSRYHRDRSCSQYKKRSKRSRSRELAEDRGRESGSTRMRRHRRRASPRESSSRDRDNAIHDDQRRQRSLSRESGGQPSSNSEGKSGNGSWATREHTTERLEHGNQLDTEGGYKRYGLIQSKTQRERHDGTSGETTNKKNLGPSADMIESRMKVMRQEQRKQLRLDSNTNDSSTTRKANLSRQERLKRLSEMSATAHQLSQERQYKAAKAEREQENDQAAPASKNFLSEFHNEVASRGDVGSRVQGRRHYIQRDASASNFMSR
eukprot:gb/GECG01012044.1/.p1 GENE.gb/GECG01012044.1/~~gb/GECG01012044.1/.p1  ORF type:complete len:512 (+),score=82.88 gb/GECG01012044.1/:1-1536(+)